VTESSKSEPRLTSVLPLLDTFPNNYPVNFQFRSANRYELMFNDDKAKCYPTLTFPGISGKSDLYRHDIDNILSRVEGHYLLNLLLSQQCQAFNILNFFFIAIYDGYPTFVISIFFIGACTAVIGDVAGHLGCFIYLKDCVNAIAFVALGTSVPGTAFENTIKCSFSFSMLYKSVPCQRVWFGFISCSYYILSMQ